MKDELARGLMTTDMASDATVSKSSLSISWPHIVLSVIGIALSCYSVFVHAQIKRGDETGCGVSDTITCDKVLSSPYSEFLSIPLGAWGIVFFVVVILTAISTKSSTATSRQNAAWRLAITAAGFLTSIALTYISVVKIGAVCPVCMATHTATLLLFLVSSYSYPKTR